VSLLGQEPILVLSGILAGLFCGLPHALFVLADKEGVLFLFMFVKVDYLVGFGEFALEFADASF